MFKKLFITLAIFTLLTSNVFAYNPNSFIDEEELRVQGKRPKVDITLSELEVTINPEDFRSGVAEKSITITNDGNVPCNLNLELQNVPVDLVVEATVDDDFLIRGESTELNISVNLTDMQETETFTFIIIIKAELR